MKIHHRNNIKSALFAGCGLLAGTVLAPAAITYSGLLGPGGAGLAIPTNFAGIYVDFGTGTTEPESADVPDEDVPTIGYTEPASWDVNFFFGGIGIAYSPTFQPFVDDTVGNRSQILNVAAGTVISSEAAQRTLGVAGGYGGSGRSNNSPGESHFDTPTVDANLAYSAFTPGAQGYIAFVLNPGAGEQYGWMSVTLTNDGTPGVIHAWAYSDEATFVVSQIPEPAAALLAGLGLLALLRRRRGA